MELKNKNITLIKLSDDKFNGRHPNGVFTGSKISGYVKSEPKIGEQLYLYYSLKLTSTYSAWTSAVKSIDYDNMILKTENSTYKIEIE